MLRKKHSLPLHGSYLVLGLLGFTRSETRRIGDIQLEFNMANVRFIINGNLGTIQRIRWPNLGTIEIGYIICMLGYCLENPLARKDELHY